VELRIVDLLVLPRGAVLKLGTDVELQVTGLRNPCAQTDKFQPDLLEAVLGRGPHGELVRKSGIMTIVLKGGGAPGDAISIAFPMPPLLPLEVLSRARLFEAFPASTFECKARDITDDPIHG
jgi:MOSC domain-containing protein YiiM